MHKVNITIHVKLCFTVKVNFISKIWRTHRHGLILLALGLNRNLRAFPMELGGGPLHIDGLATANIAK
jgi:hypothetical protein